MGGRNSQGYQMFQQLTVKAFLAIRPHADQIVSTVQMMLETQLPSFKGEPTIKRLRDRFALGLTERQAAEWMMAIVRNAHENVRSTAYDEFQRVSPLSLLLVVLVLIKSPAAAKWYVLLSDLVWRVPMSTQESRTNSLLRAVGCGGVQDRRIILYNANATHRIHSNECRVLRRLQRR